MAKEKGKKKSKTAKKLIIAIIATIIGALALVVLVYVGRILKLRSDALEKVAGVTADNFRQTEASVIYDINGAEISSLSGIKELYYLESKDIPTVLKQTFVQIEDQDFYTHSGIDLKAIVRAALMNAQSDSIVQGASTITQQLAKKTFLTDEVSYNRKITEIFVAFELEKMFSKDQILEFYINNIYFANGYYGIEAAAQGYFGKHANQLSISQMAFLAGIPNNPNKYDPITNYDKAITRRNSVLKQMYAAGIISSLEYYTAIEDEIALCAKETERYNYVETYVFYCATLALMEANGFTIRYEFENDEDKENYQNLYDSYYKQYQASLFTGGYRIYTSIDMTKQEELQAAVDEYLKDFTDVNSEGIYKMQGAGVCINNNTGLVEAIVGGRSQDYDGYTLNRAYQSYRQPGSSIKPLLDYAPYMEAGHNPEEIIDDSEWPTGPKNVGGTYRGLITLREALGWSSNVAAWKILAELTPRVGMAYLHKMNFAKISMDDDIQATSIGGFTYGVTPVEMAAAYATLENDGLYRKPTCIRHIDRSDGTTIVAQSSATTKVYSQNTVRMITKMLEWGVQEGLMTGAKLPNAYVAVKSGSTNDNKDGWLAGYSRYYTTVVWTGMDMPETVPNLYGGTYPLSIWRDFMTKIHEGTTKLAFPDYIGHIADVETSASGQEQPTTGRPGWTGGGNLDYEDGDFNHDIDPAGKGDQDASLPY